jgi:hypothetical protein
MIFNDKERGHHDRDPLHLTAIIRSSMIRRGAIMTVQCRSYNGCEMKRITVMMATLLIIEDLIMAVR